MTVQNARRRRDVSRVLPVRSSQLGPAVPRGVPLRADPFRHVIGPLTGTKFDDAKIRELVRNEWIIFHDRFDLIAAFSQCEDDSPLARDLSPRDEKLTGRIVLFQESNVRLHVRVDFGERDFVRELDDEHGCTDVASFHLHARRGREN
jgi:hypothetical protein